MITLYDLGLSGNCHKIRLLLSMLDLPFKTVAMNLAAGDHRQPAYLALNPFGQVPTLTDGEVVMRDSQGILVYLAKRYGGSAWWPEAPALQGEIAGWLSTAANEIAQGPNSLRLHRKFGRAIDQDRASAITSATLGIIDSHVTMKKWLVGDGVTIADLAIYPYLALAPEGGVDLAVYPNILRWFADIRALKGYVGMPGMWQA
jgi:glutathione S-transferase